MNSIISNLYYFNRLNVNEFIYLVKCTRSAPARRVIVELMFLHLHAFKFKFSALAAEAPAGLIIIIK